MDDKTTAAVKKLLTTAKAVLSWVPPGEDDLAGQIEDLETELRATGRDLDNLNKELKAQGALESLVRSGWTIEVSATGGPGGDLRIALVSPDHRVAVAQDEIFGKAVKEAIARAGMQDSATAEPAH